MTAPRIVQSGSGAARPLIVGFLIGSQLDARLRELFGPEPCIVAWESFGAPEAGAQLIAEYRAAASSAGWDGAGDVYLVGWSLGCTRIRSVLPALTAKPKAVLCLDGTTASYPTPAPGQMDVWQELVRAARAGETTAVLTCTSMEYEKRLTTAPFWPTIDLLQKVTGWPLDVARKPDDPDSDIGVTSDGDLHVARFSSTDIDAAAHEDQVNKVLFWAAKRWLLPLLAGDIAPPTDRMLGGHTLPPPAPLGERVVAFYRAEMSLGTCEVPAGCNTGERIRQFLAPCRRRGTEVLLGLTAGAWCCAIYCFACASVALGGEPYPAPRAAGEELQADAYQDGAWHDVAAVRAGTWTPRIGDACVLSRGAPGAWTRHVVAVSSLLDAIGNFHSVGGNEDDHIKESIHSLHDADVLGFVALG